MFKAVIVPFQFGDSTINIGGIEGIIGVFSPNEPLTSIQKLHKDFGVEIHGDDTVIILVRPQVIM